MAKNGLYQYTHPHSGIIYIRGSYLGVAVDESARTRDSEAAGGILRRREREIYDEVVLGKKRSRLFAEAAVGYMLTKGLAARALLAPILTTRILVDEEVRIFGELLANEIDQSVVDALAFKLYPEDNATNSTRNRKIYTPVSAVMKWQSRQKWGVTWGGLQRPQQPKGRIDWRRPAEIEWWIGKAGGIGGAILTAYVGTGARASEMINLDWLNVSPQATSFVLWDDETKAGQDRSVEIQSRVRDVLPERGEGKVWRSSTGEPWHDYDALNLMLRRISEAEALLRADAVDREQFKALRGLGRSIKKSVTAQEKDRARKAARQLMDDIIAKTKTPTLHLHVLRHTWATWAYAVTNDIAWVMREGGWASEKLALRYIHVGTRDLKAEVLAHGWEMRPVLAEASPASAALAPAMRPALPAPTRRS